MSQLTFYPDASPETSTVDGIAWYTHSGTTWATIHDAATGTNADDTLGGNSGDDFIVRVKVGSTGSNYQQLWRSMFLFDTSSIPDTATIDSATIDFYVGNTTDALSQSFNIVSASPASNTAVTTADYDQFGTTKFASDTTIASLTTGAYNSIALNAAGLAAINVSGITKFGVRLTSDIGNSAPTGSAFAQSWVQAGFAEGTSDQRTRLVVNYTEAATGKPKTLSMLGVG